MFTVVSAWILIGCCSALFLLLVDVLTIQESSLRIPKMLENINVQQVKDRENIVELLLQHGGTKEMFSIKEPAGLLNGHFIDSC